MIHNILKVIYVQIWEKDMSMNIYEDRKTELQVDSKISVSILITLEMSKLRHLENKKLPQGYATGKWGSLRSFPLRFWK